MRRNGIYGNSEAPKAACQRVYSLFAFALLCQFLLCQTNRLKQRKSAHYSTPFDMHSPGSLGLRGFTSQLHCLQQSFAGNVEVISD